MVVKITIFFIAAMMLYVMLCAALNTYFKKEFKYPKKMLYSDKDITVMAAAGAAISSAGLYFGFDSNSVLRLILFYVLCAFLAAAAVIDIKKRIIPNWIIFALFSVWAVYIVICFVFVGNGIAALINSAAGFIFSLLVFGFGYLFMKNKLGGGDVKLTLVMGLILTGDAIFGAMIYGLGLSLIFALGAVITGKMKMKDCMPFAPFLFLGTAAAIAVM